MVDGNKANVTSHLEGNQGKLRLFEPVGEPECPNTQNLDFNLLGVAFTSQTSKVALEMTHVGRFTE
jgi:hypothetical protein